MPDPWSYAEKTNTEHAHQTALFMWANMAVRHGVKVANISSAYTMKGLAESFSRNIENNGFDKCVLPQLKWLHAIHNQGHGDAVRGANAKAEGVKAGVFDLFLPYPVKDIPRDISNGQNFWIVETFAGLYIEMKRPKSARGAAGKLSDDQQAFKDYAEQIGYKCVECWTWLEARDAILQYLGVTNG